MGSFDAGFTAHNITLPDGTQTCPQNPVLAETASCQTILRLFDREGVRTIADLGCLEGGHAVALAQAGFEVTGVEARARNIANCQIVEEAFALPNLRFVQDDVRNLAAHGPFDGVLCSGLLYHLDQPAAFLKLLGKVTGKILVVQTHWSGGRVENEGRKGHWYADFPSESDAWGSYGNKRSFWLCMEDLMDAMRDAGFSDVWYEGETTLPGAPPRGIFVGTKGAQ